MYMKSSGAVATFSDGKGGGGARSQYSPDRRPTGGGGGFFISRHRDPGLFPKDPGLLASNAQVV